MPEGLADELVRVVEVTTEVRVVEMVEEENVVRLEAVVLDLLEALDEEELPPLPPLIVP